MEWMRLSIPLMVLLAASAQAEVDCAKRPDFNVMKDCCHIPRTNWIELSQECSRFINPNLKQHTPCAVDCVFNSSKILQDGEVNMANVQQLASRALSDEFAQVFVAGFENCVPTVKEYLAQMKQTARPMRLRPGDARCSPDSFIYSICVHRYMYLNCPAASWTPSSACEYAKEYGQTCEDTVSGLSPRRGRGRLRGRRPSGLHHQRQRQVDDQQAWVPTFEDIFAEF